MLNTRQTKFYFHYKINNKLIGVTFTVVNSDQIITDKKPRNQHTAVIITHPVSSFCSTATWFAHAATEKSRWCVGCWNLTLPLSVFFFRRSKSLESNSWTRRKLLGATHDDARAQRITDPPAVEAARQTSISVIPSPKRLFCSFSTILQILRFRFFRLAWDVALKTWAPVGAQTRLVVFVTEKRDGLNVSGNAYQGSMQTPVSVTEGEQNTPKETSGSTFSLWAEMRSALPAASANSINMVDVSPWTPLDSWPPTSCCRSTRCLPD